MTVQAMVECRYTVAAMDPMMQSRLSRTDREKRIPARAGEAPEAATEGMVVTRTGTRPTLWKIHVCHASLMGRLRLPPDPAAAKQAGVIAGMTPMIGRIVTEIAPSAARRRCPDAV
jgi:hypothetical protein